MRSLSTSFPDNGLNEDLSVPGSGLRLKGSISFLLETRKKAAPLEN